MSEEQFETNEEPFKSKEELVEYLEANTKFRNISKDWRVYLYSFRFYVYIAIKDIDLANDFFDPLVYECYKKQKPITEAIELMNEKIHTVMTEINKLKKNSKKS